MWQFDGRAFILIFSRIFLSGKGRAFICADCRQTAGSSHPDQNGDATVSSLRGNRPAVLDIHTWTRQVDPPRALTDWWGPGTNKTLCSPCRACDMVAALIMIQPAAISFFFLLPWSSSKHAWPSNNVTIGPVHTWTHAQRRSAPQCWRRAAY